MDQRLNWKIRLFDIAIGIIFGWLFFYSCNKPEPEYVNTKTEIKHLYDTTIHHYHWNKTREIHYRDSVRHQLTFDDSVDIWYRMQYAFYATDSVYLYDSTGVIFKGLIEDSIYSNRITWRQFSGQVTRPVTIVSQTFEPVKKRSINLGLSATGNRTSSALYIDLGYTDLKDFSYTVGYNLIDKGVHLGVEHPMLRFE